MRQVEWLNFYSLTLAPAISQLQTEKFCNCGGTSRRQVSPCFSSPPNEAYCAPLTSGKHNRFQVKVVLDGSRFRASCQVGNLAGPWSDIGGSTPLFASPFRRRVHKRRSARVHFAMNLLSVPCWRGLARIQCGFLAASESHVVRVRATRLLTALCAGPRSERGSRV